MIASTPPRAAAFPHDDGPAGLGRDRRRRPSASAERRIARSHACQRALVLLALGSACIAAIAATLRPARADDGMAGAQAPATPSAATDERPRTPEEQVEVSLEALEALCFERPGLERRLARAREARDALEGAPPVRAAAQLELEELDRAIEHALQELAAGCEAPSGRGALVNAVRGSRRSTAVVDLVAPLVAARCGEPGATALTAIASARPVAELGPIAQALAGSDAPAARRWVEVRLLDPNCPLALRRTMVRGLALEGSAAPLLARLLLDPEPELASAAAARLRRLRVPDDAHGQRTLDALRSALVDERHDRRLLAVGSLACLSGPTALRELDALCGDATPSVAAAAVATLGRLEGPMARAVLLRELRNPYRAAPIRRAAAQELGRLGERRAIADLVDMTRHADLRDHAAAALRAISGETYGPSYALWAGWYARQRAAAGS